MLLDVDNGPAAFAGSNNAGLYDDRGIAAACAALKMDGVLAVWSAREDRKFEQRLRYGGFDVEVERVRGRLKRAAPPTQSFSAANLQAGDANRARQAARGGSLVCRLERTPFVCFHALTDVSNRRSVD